MIFPGKSLTPARRAGARSGMADATLVGLFFAGDVTG
jgi:hypothetical protein